jgi:hypothetical protein
MNKIVSIITIIGFLVLLFMVIYVNASLERTEESCNHVLLILNAWGLNEDN